MSQPVELQFYEGDLSEERLLHYQKSGVVAIDTETGGLNPYRDRLYLIQLGDAQSVASLVRPRVGATPNLNRLLTSPDVLKVFHFARFDITMLRHHLGADTRNIYCTKIASKLARTYTDKHGLKDVVGDMLGIQLDKTSQTTDWGASELSEAQMRYAVNDILHLIPVMHKLNFILEREGRGAIAQACFDFLPTRALLDLGGWEDVFSHH